MSKKYRDREPAHQYLRRLGKKAEDVIAVLYSHEEDCRRWRMILIIEKVRDENAESDCRFTIFKGKEKRIIWFSGSLARMLAARFPEKKKRMSKKPSGRRGRL